MNAVVEPGYRQTEVGMIPEDWKVECIGALAKVGRGRVISHREISKSITKSYPVYSSQTSNEGVMGYLDTHDFEGEYITWTTDGANAGTVFYRNGKFNCTNVCGTISCFNDDAYYISKALSVIAPKHVSRNLGNPKLMNDVVKRISIALPSTVSEQRAIATALSDMDALISGLDQLIAKKRDIKQATMQQLLTGQTRLPGFSGEWRKTCIADHIDLLTGFPFPSGKYAASGIRLLRGSNVKRGKTDWSEDLVQYWPRVTGDIARYELISGDLVIAMDGSLVGRSFARLCSSDLPAVLLQRVARIRSSSLDLGYLTHHVASEYFSNYCDSVKTVTAIPHISPGDIKGFIIPLPPTKAEQIAIATVLSDMDAELVTLESRLDKSKQLKQGLMQELLTGRIRLV